MSTTELIGYVAAFLTTCSFVPQALHTFRTRDVRGISLGMYSVFTAGVALWLGDGGVLAAWPLVGGHALTLVLAGCCHLGVCPLVRSALSPMDGAVQVRARCVVVS